MKPVTAETIRRLDREASDKFGVSGLTLMENAGQGIVNVIARDYPPCHVAVFAGKGNNGGDGFVAARHLASKSFTPEVFLLGDPDNLSPDSRVNFLKLRAIDVPVHQIPREAFEDEIARMIGPETTLIIDAVFGIGLTRAPQGVFEATIQAINLSGRPVVSIDVPTGLDSDTGKVYGAAVKAARTLTLALPKTGLFILDGPAYAGAIEIVDIGLPKELLAPYLT